MYRRQSIIFLAVSILLLIVPACKSNRNTATEPYEGSVANETATPSHRGKKAVEEAVVALVKSYKSWQDVSMSFKCKLRSPKNMNVSGKATMIRGRQIQISMRMLGFEVAGLYIDSDSAYVYEKLNRTMIAEPLSRLQSLSGMTLTDIQDLLLGRICYPGATKSGKAMLGNFNIENVDGRILLKPRKSSIDWRYELADTDPVELMCVLVSLGAKGEAVCGYAAPLMTDVGPISPRAMLTATAGKNKIDATIDWSLETASWNKGISPKVNIPKGYRRIGLQQLIKALQ